MVRFEKKIGWYAVISIAIAAAALFAGEPAWLPVAWLAGTAYAWGSLWWAMRRYERNYRLAMIFHLKRYEEMLVDNPDEFLAGFISLTKDEIEARSPLMKMNRWLGYIQRSLIEKGYTTVQKERDLTREHFHPLDFGA